MASTTYFGRAERDGCHLGADFDLLAKWARACSLDHPVHSYYLTQLSNKDRAQLFTGPAKEFHLKQGPDNTVKLETLQDEVNRLDPEVIDMIRSTNYRRSEARLLELLNEIEDAQPKADSAAALVLSKALSRGVDPLTAEKAANQLSDKILDYAGHKVKARWKAARDERLMGFNDQTPGSPKQVNPTPKNGSFNNAVDESNTSDTGDSSIGKRSTRRKRVKGVALNTSFRRFVNPTLADHLLSKPAANNADGNTAFNTHPGDVGDNHSAPQQKIAAESISPNSSLPDYGSETSADSAYWNSPPCSAGESPSSPDIDSETAFFEEADGGVTLLPTSLAEELGFKDESGVATPIPALRFDRFGNGASSGHLGAGLDQAFIAVPSSFNGLPASNTLVNASNLSAAVGPLSAHTAQVIDTAVRHNIKVEASSCPFLPNSKIKDKYPLAKEQPWMGFRCYEVNTNLGNNQLVPKYWTTKRGKERYLRHKIGDLKLDDAKLRSDRILGTVARNPIHIFIDLSNIIIGFYDSMKESRGLSINKRVMAPAFSFKNFDTILTRDRNVAKRIVAGSLTNSYNKRWPGYMIQAQELKYEMNILERVPKPASSPVRKRKPKAGPRDADASTSGHDTSGEECFFGPMKHGEQGVDELLHLKILQSAMDTPSPATMVLATGDAASAQYSDGFKKNIERVLALGWNIELYGWSRNISSAWREPDFAEKWEHQFKIIELDEFCEELFDMTIESLEQ
ncbi:hypothetical protein MYCTH_2309349 [Thermothelomyces thermophilus ATCC 42464]|uniref:NYN domain-containing protein n=1 Tax=Thermothelomyces thermophilus (strain ATCC 42464 / BCRC 31852 / DSM 1799) TaxID=573729 RepID=G2QI68_THET4|nr:uncharacterized protein MYCTH_2309349 [Thermothelomyces thermophilus ATCC 42464]AEO60257.1 hypothetical protein MYCTH_2309349 [Thermothelomyces thermophilus ATCC 42464]